MTELQKMVVEKAREELKDEPWFTGVCIDLLKEMSDEDIRRDGVEKAAEALVLDTMYWDAPTSMGRSDEVQRSRC